MNLPRTSLLALISLMACDLPPKLCHGDCSPTPDPDEPSAGEASNDEPVDICAVTDDLGTAGVCADGVQEPGEFCLGNFGGGPVFGNGLVSVVTGPFDGLGGDDLLLSHTDRTVTFELDGPAPFLDMTGGSWPLVFPVESVTLTGTGDLDGDGKLDAVARRVGFIGDSVELLFLDHGQLLQSQSVSLDAISFGPEVVDWNQDGHLDVITMAATTESPITRIVLLGDGTGQFTATPQPELVGPVFGLHALGAFHADGAPDDFAVIDPAGVLAIKSGADVTFTDVQLPPDAIAHHLALTDLDGDDLGDVVALYEDTVTGGSSVLVALQTLEGFTTTEYRVHCGATTFALGDLDLDGIRDLVAGGPLGSFATIRRGDGQGGYAAARIIPLGPADQLHLADFNGDGSIDVVAADHAGAALITQLNTP